MDHWTPADEYNLGMYLAFMREHREKVGPLGNVRTGEIEIATDREAARRCVMAMRERLEKKDIGKHEALEWTRLGVVFEDQYGRLVRFPVLFPPNRKKGETEPVGGTYITWYWHALFGRTGAACGMPILADGRLVLTKAYRHATREWTLEFPRGGSEDVGKSVLDVLRSELGTEAGITIAETIPLGLMEPDNGLLSSVIPLFLVRVASLGESDREYAEAISGLAFFTPEEFQKVLNAEQWNERLPGDTDSWRTYRVRGAFEEVAFSRARRRGLI